LLLALLAISSLTRAERLPIKIYTTVDGLAHNNINKIVRDSRGFLWFCTGDGLSRFDGYTFTTYGTDQGLPHREVTDFLETRSGEYWVATYAGLVRFNPKAPPERRVVYANENGSRAGPMFTVIAPDEGDRYARAITVLLEDHNGVIWCGSFEGFYRLERGQGRFALRPVRMEMPAGEGQNINDLLEDKRGSLWIAAPSGLYRRLTGAWRVTPNATACRTTSFTTCSKTMRAGYGRARAMADSSNSPPMTVADLLSSSKAFQCARECRPPGFSSSLRLRTANSGLRAHLACFNSSRTATSRGDGFTNTVKGTA
jgi:ligand-binding sensor domain-containing protein